MGISKVNFCEILCTLQAEHRSYQSEEHSTPRQLRRKLLWSCSGNESSNVNSGCGMGGVGSVTNVGSVECTHPRAPWWGRGQE